MHLIGNFLYCVDPSLLGKVDKASFSQQTLMELFIDGFGNKKRICGRRVKDVTDWDGVTMNERNEVTRMDWGHFALEGSVHLEWLPATVEWLGVHANELSGTLDLSSLPENLTFLNLSGNSFIGEISLKSLPGKMEVLNVQRNKLSGNVDVRSLPAGMKQLNLFWNNFEKETDFSRLPERLQVLDVSNTKLSGEIHIEEATSLSMTNLTGKLFNVANSGVKLIG